MLPALALCVVSLSAVMSVRRGGGLSLAFLFFLSMLFFQCIPLAAFAYFVYPDHDYSIHSQGILWASLGFIVGYYVAPSLTQRKGSSRADARINLLLYDLGRWTILATFPVCLAIAVVYITSSRAANYGFEPGMRLGEQIFMYASIFGLQLVYASLRLENDKERLLLAALVLLPRLIISISYARFFFLQVLLPVFVLEMLLWRRRNSATPRWLPYTAAALMLVFLTLPLYIRGTSAGAFYAIGDYLQGFFFGGSSITILDEYLRVQDLLPDISFSLGSLFFSIFPFLATGPYLIDLYDRELVTRLDRALSKLTVADTSGPYMGTGGNFVVDLYADAGLPAVFAGALLIGWLTRYYELRFLVTPFATLIAFHIVSRIVYLPRGTFPEYFDRVVHFLLLWMLLVGILQFAIRAVDNFRKSRKGDAIGDAMREQKLRAAQCPEE